MRPLVGLTSCVRQLGDLAHHAVQDKYIRPVVVGMDAVPVLLPALPGADAMVERLDGLVLTGSTSHVDPRHYGEAPADPDHPRDPIATKAAWPSWRRRCVWACRYWRSVAACRN